MNVSIRRIQASSCWVCKVETKAKQQRRIERKEEVEEEEEERSGVEQRRLNWAE